MALSSLNSEQAERAQRARDVILGEIEAAGGEIPFDRYMELALYAPGAGYYVNGAQKFGKLGDFVTAPEISPLFSQCLANQCAGLLDRLDGNILEFGAGSGVMAADVLARLESLDALPDRYQILELSAELRIRQRETLIQRVPHLVGGVEWLERLPEPGWQGVMLGNEVLDAMPVTRFRRDESGWQASRIAYRKGRFVEQWGQAGRALTDRLASLQARLGAFPVGYLSEINLRLAPWFEAVAQVLQRGALLLIDYGYPERAYYHPERRQGTLICHFQHRAHDDFLALPGLQDITANVDFSAVAEAGVAAGLELAGYTTQAQFLIGCGLDRLLAEMDAGDSEAYLMAVQAAKQLILPSAMGERFQAIAFTRNLEQPLSAFAMSDLRESL